MGKIMDTLKKNAIPETIVKKALVTQQGDNTIYTVVLTFKEIADLLTINQDNTHKKSQRKLNKSRVKKLVNFITATPDYRLPSIEIECDPSIIYIEEKDEITTIELTVDDKSNVNILDGQHRVAAILDYVKQFPLSANEQSIVVVINEYIQLSVSRQRFVWFNFGKKVSSNLTACYDRHFYTEIYQAIYDKLFKSIVTIEEGVGKKNKYLFGYKPFTEKLVKPVLQAINATNNFANKSNKPTTKLKAIGLKIFDAVNNLFPEWKEISYGELDPSEYKQDTIIATGVIVALGIVIKRLIDENYIQFEPSDNKEIVNEEVLKLFGYLEPIKNVNWLRTNPKWRELGVVVDDNKLGKNNPVYKRLADYLWDLIQDRLPVIEDQDNDNEQLEINLEKLPVSDLSLNGSNLDKIVV